MIAPTVWKMGEIIPANKNETVCSRLKRGHTHAVYHHNTPETQKDGRTKEERGDHNAAEVSSNRLYLYGD